MTEFQKYILDNHPDPDSLCGNQNTFDQMCRLSESYAQSKVKNIGALADVINWASCDYITGEGMPTEYGKYLICRKDGKIHWETYNGSGWAYNGNVIKYWAVITKPC